jgi:hypothetical protein
MVFVMVFVAAAFFMVADWLMRMVVTFILGIGG